MQFLARFILKVIFNALAIFLIAYLIPGIDFKGDFLSLLAAALALGLINTFLKPMLKLFFAPFLLLSLGLFAIVINTGLLWLLTKIIQDLTISGIWTYLEGGLSLSIMNVLTSWLIKAQKKKEE